MNGTPDNPTGPERFDRVLRALHGQAVAQVSPHTLARLRPRPAPARTPFWHGLRAPLPLAAACAAALLALAALQLQPGADSNVRPQLAAVESDLIDDPPPLYDDALAAFEEDPDLFIWLATAQPVAME